MSKLYKAIDKIDGTESGFLINTRGVAVARWFCSDNDEINQWKNVEHAECYLPLTRFDDAIDPVLIAEW